MCRIYTCINKLFYNKLSNLKNPLVEYTFMVHWVVRSILLGGLMGYFSFQPVLNNWFNKESGICCPDYGMVHIKDLLLLIEKSSPFSDNSGFPLLLSE